MTITTNTNYMKKNLQIAAMALALGCSTINAQNGRSISGKAPGTTPSNSNEQKTFIPNRGCGTGVPDQAWEDQFQKQIQEFLARNMSADNSRINAANYTIPVIIHVVHGGQAVGTYPNLAQAQLNSQITVLNQDYGGTGFNTGNYPATAFQSYASSSVALSASLSAANKDASGRVAIANTNVQFCLALKDTAGNVLAEPGIERINYTTKGWTNPASFTSSGTFQAYIDGTIKPQSVWNVSKYLNIWVTDENVTSVGLLGYATFPPSSGNTGLSGPYGTASTDGFWAYAKCFGSANIYPAGTYDATYKYGRTCTHEIGHWLGLRHIWGDGGVQCGATDYCVDTPPQRGTTGPPAGCYYGVPTYPANANTCTRNDGTAGASVKNLNGDMFMNFMDYTDDVAMYMFTTDQRTRIQTTMLNSPYRKFLGTHGLCSLAASSPTANFTMASSGCTGAGITVSNLSTGSPSPTYSWSATPATGVTFNPSSTATSPTITFATPGTYSVKVVATNSLGTSNATNVINITVCTTPCADTLTNLKNTDTLTLYTGGGYVGGNNSYGDLEKAEWYSSTGLVGTSKIMGGIVIFYRHATANIGTKGTSGITFKVYNGNNTSGPSGAAINTFTNSITNILASATATNQVTYCGNPGLAYSTNIMRPYSFNFAAPTNITGDFLIGCTTSTLSGDTIAIFSSTGNTAPASTAWELQSGPTWVKFNDGTTASWQLNASLAILPKIACVTDVYNVNGISGNIAIFPNPSNGNFNFAVTMPQVSDLNFTVINSIGQVVYTKMERGVTNAVINMNLSHLSKGIYFVNVIDSTGDKVTKKIIIE